MRGTTPEEELVAIEGPGTETKLDALTDAAAALARASDLDAAIGAILDATVGAVGATAGAVFLRQPDSPILYVAARHGLDDAAVAAFEREVEDPAHPVAAAARDVAAVFDRAVVGADPRARSAADLPLVVTHEGLDLALGVMTLAWARERTTSRSEQQLARAAADLIAAAVDRAHLGALLAERAEWYERLTHTDALTGLANRRTFERVLEMDLARAARQRTELSLVVFDVDDFGNLNATRGHAVGDDVLRTIAATIAEGVRLVDTVARLGPDEFIVSAPGAGGVVVARRILATLAAGNAEGGEPFTTSAAVVRYPSDGSDGPELIAAAEAAIARAKAQGPGSVEAAEYLAP